MALRQGKLNLQPSYSTAQVRAGTMTGLPKHKELIYKNIILPSTESLILGPFFLLPMLLSTFLKQLSALRMNTVLGKLKLFFHEGKKLTGPVLTSVLFCTAQMDNRYSGRTKGEEEIRDKRPESGNRA